MTSDPDIRCVRVNSPSMLQSADFQELFNPVVPLNLSMSPVNWDASNLNEALGGVVQPTTDDESTNNATVVMREMAYQTPQIGSSHQNRSSQIPYEEPLHLPAG
jgi:hypothetical protein